MFVWTGQMACEIRERKILIVGQVICKLKADQYTSQEF